ncbi:hypothetical protein B0H11DRAFT_2376937 [Mycena galericulata]|nr:hypothetical protein B0H11DRAFT_2376937 [Mycena galericulata]
MSTRCFPPALFALVGVIGLPTCTIRGHCSCCGCGPYAGYAAGYVLTGIGDVLRGRDWRRHHRVLIPLRFGEQHGLRRGLDGVEADAQDVRRELKDERVPAVDVLAFPAQPEAREHVEHEPDRLDRRLPREALATGHWHQHQRYTRNWASAGAGDSEGVPGMGVGGGGFEAKKCGAGADVDEVCSRGCGMGTSGLVAKKRERGFAGARIGAWARCTGAGVNTNGFEAKERGLKERPETLASRFLTRSSCRIACGSENSPEMRTVLSPSCPQRYIGTRCRRNHAAWTGEGISGTRGAALNCQYQSEKNRRPRTCKTENLDTAVGLRTIMSRGKGDSIAVMATSFSSNEGAYVELDELRARDMIWMRDQHGVARRGKFRVHIGRRSERPDRGGDPAEPYTKAIERRCLSRGSKMVCKVKLAPSVILHTLGYFCRRDVSDQTIRIPRNEIGLVLEENALRA